MRAGGGLLNHRCPPSIGFADSGARPEAGQIDRATTSFMISEVPP
ncbi:MAG: hypothetical protein RL588_1896 [Pseudomonadota bacterium]|jgi:hypothetical protein